MKEFNQNRGKGPAVSLKNVSYRYPDGHVAVNHINLDMETSEKVGIIGPNGAGKSTLITLLNGSRRGEGNIEICGIPLNQKNLRRIKSNIGLVFQNPDDQLFCPTIQDDVAFGPLNMGLSPSEAKTRVSQALSEVGLEGYETRSSIHISFGEKKLAAIASILSMDPRVIALDEPTSNLDHLHRRKIIQWIQKNERTIIITSHDLDLLLETTDRIVILNSGSLTADGSTYDILRNEFLLKENNLELPLSIKTNVYS